jgi:outer membrane protein
VIRYLSWIFFTLATPAAAQGHRAVTLGEAVALAARTDPGVVQARGNLHSSGIGVRAAKSRYLPSLSATGSGGSSFSDGPDRFDPITNQLVSGNTKSQSVNLGLSTDLDLFTGFRRGGAIKEAQGREDVADAALVEALASSSLQTANDFFSARQSLELVEARRRGVARAEQQLQIANARLQTRAATVSDSLRAVVQLGEARLTLATEEAQLARTEAALGRRLGLGGRIAAVDDSLLRAPGPPMDTVALRTEALSRAPSVRRTEASVRAAEGGLTAAQADWWPQLTLNANYSYAGNNANSYQLFNNRNLTLGVRWPLFNRFQRDQQVSQSQTTLDTERARYEDARHQVDADLTTQFAALQAAEQRIALAQLSLRAAQADAAVALERYRLGSISITDLNAAESGLTRAEESAVTARFDYLRARAQIEAILGRPL